MEKNKIKTMLKMPRTTENSKSPSMTNETAEGQIIITQTPNNHLVTRKGAV